jgi:ferric-dicitrate binding protein FerR (iron transport regulator)
MKKKSPYALGLAMLLSASVSIPADVWAGPQNAGQRAGEISRVIPAVSIARGSKTITGSANTAVDWLDVVNTQTSARARIALDDGSILNVGSDSSLKILKHDASAQQTELELEYGKLRSQAQKITKTDGKFEVHTPAGVAGVVGTDFYVSYDPTTGTMNVIVFEGLVKVCNLAGVCVIVKAGQMSGVRNGDNSAPQNPTQATLDLLTEAGSTTMIGNGPGPGVSAHHFGKGAAVTLGILAAIPAIVIPIVATRGKGTQAPLNPCPSPQAPGCG